MHLKMVHAHKIGALEFRSGDTFLASENVGSRLLAEGHAVRIDVPATTGGGDVKASPPAPAENTPAEQVNDVGEETPEAATPVETSGEASPPAPAVKKKPGRKANDTTGGEAK